MQKFIRADMICAMLNVTIRTLARWIERGEFPPPDIKVSRVRLWDKATVDAWIADQQHKQKPAIA